MGATVGVTVGDLLGAREGTAVGDALGLTEGANVSPDCVGDTVGVAVGADGFAVGACEERDHKGYQTVPTNVTRDDPPITWVQGLPSLPSNITREVTHHGWERRG